MQKAQIVLKRFSSLFIYSFFEETIVRRLFYLLEAMIDENVFMKLLNEEFARI